MILVTSHSVTLFWHNREIRGVMPLSFVGTSRRQEWANRALQVNSGFKYLLRPQNTTMNGRTLQVNDSEWGIDRQISKSTNKGLDLPWLAGCLAVEWWQIGGVVCRDVDNLLSILQGVFSTRLTVWLGYLGLESRQFLHSIFKLERSVTKSTISAN